VPGARERLPRMRNQRSLVAAAGIAALLIPAAAAQAATKQVTIGPAKPLKGVPPVAFDADFYPRKITIAKGDHIRFKWTTGFGDVIFAPKGEAAPSFAVPAGTVADAKDEAGAAMWFNGQPNLAPNMEALAPQGGKAIDGSKVVGSGFAFDGPMKPWKVRFTKAGTYRLTSVIQPTKKLTVTVKKNAKGVPGAKADKRRIAKQVKASTKLAKKLVAFEGPEGNVVRAGNDAKGIAQIAFFPAKKTVKVGDTVRFEMSRSSMELHNVAFGPKPYLDSKPFLGPVLNPFVVYRSEAPGTAASFDGTNHGNGYYNSGLLDADSHSPFPSSDSVTFTKAGTYTYYCAVHGNDMKGEIVVQ
jgi:plastocyanin